MSKRLSLKQFILPAIMMTLAGSIPVPSHAAPAQYSATISEGRAIIKKLMEDSGLASVSVALVEDGNVVWSEAFGMADSAAGRKATADTLYGTASISKMVATVSTMILVERGLIALDEPVVKYVKKFDMPLDPRFRKITVRMLLNHSSALPGQEIRDASTLEPFTGYAALMMDGFMMQRLKHDPGAISAYNNDGFTMVENLVKEVTGQDYPNFVRQNVLDSLNMRNSRFQNLPLPEGSYAKAHKDGKPKRLDYLNAYASGGLFSTPEELAHLGSMLANGGVFGSSRILSEKSVEEMAKDQSGGQFNPVPFYVTRFGLGWDTVTQPGLLAVNVVAQQKGGALPEYRTLMTVIPDKKLVFVIFAAVGSETKRLSPDQPEKTSEQILLRALLEKGVISSMPKPLPKADLAVKTVSAELKKRYAGHYAYQATVYRLGFAPDNSLTVDEFGAKWAPKYQKFKLRSDGWFAADADPVTALRLLTEDGRHYIAVRKIGASSHYSTTMLTGQKLEGRRPLSKVWKERIAERWLLVNGNSWFFSVGGTNMQMNTVSGLPGYGLGYNLLREQPYDSSRLDGMFLMLPGGVRDQKDASIEVWGGEEWLRLGTLLARPQSGVPVLASGKSSIVIGNEGHTEWRKLPASGVIKVSGASYWFLYDEKIKQVATGTGDGNATFKGKGGKYLALFGKNGDEIRLDLTDAR